MAIIYRHPGVEDYFATLDYNQGGTALGKAATELYEDSKAVLLNNVKVDFDRNFIANLHFDRELRSNKKFKSLAFARNYESGLDEYAELLTTTFSGDKDKFAYFGKQISSVNEQVVEITNKLFPGYNVVKPSITWRLTDAINENLHFDVYKEDLPNHHARLFVNLDVIPRIWHTSHTLEHVLSKSLHLLESDVIRSDTAGRICNALNFKIFKGFEVAGREGADKHIVFFEPGDVWFVDSRKVSHQIFYGRKALSTEHEILPSSMNNPELHYYNIVEKYRHRLLDEKVTASL